MISNIVYFTKILQFESKYLQTKYYKLKYLYVKCTISIFYRKYIHNYLNLLIR